MTFGKKFCSTRRRLIGEYRELASRIRIGHEPFLQLMKKLLTVSLCSLSFVLTSFGQTPPPPPAAGSPAVSAPANPAAPAGAMPATTDPALAPTAPASMPGLSPAAGLPPPPTAAATQPAAASAAPGAAAAAAGVPGATHVDTGNFLIDNFRKGGPIMWPILIVSITAIAVVLERVCWWLMRWTRRDPKRIEKVFTAIEVGDVAEASRLSRDSRDPVLRMMWNGLNHQHASLQGALQVAAGIEIKRAGRFLVVMDTLVTLAPLLGLLGTITGLMKSFSFLGNEELAVQAVTGGIAEALIATACGLGIAIFALIPFNFFTSRVSNLEFELQTAATNLEVMLEAQNKAKAGDMDITALTK
jgi:biopolymer transport protein ExbB